MHFMSVYTLLLTVVLRVSGCSSSPSQPQPRRCPSARQWAVEEAAAGHAGREEAGGGQVRGGMDWVKVLHVIRAGNKS